MPAEAFDMIRSSLQCLHERLGFLGQAFLTPGRQTGAHPLPEIPVQIFIRLMFRRRWRQRKSLNPLLMLIKPLLHHLAMGHPEIVQSQEDLPFNVLFWEKISYSSKITPYQGADIVSESSCGINALPLHRCCKNSCQA
jgi:hypothetical protein